jgi:hypothetical protein
VEPGGLMGQLQTVTCWDLMAADSGCTAACKMSAAAAADHGVPLLALLQGRSRSQLHYKWASAARFVLHRCLKCHGSFPGGSQQ